MTRTAPHLRWLLAWLVFLVYFAGVALYLRDARHHQLADKLATDMTAQVEQHDVDWTLYFYGEWWSPQSIVPQPSQQGASIYLMELGYETPELLRALLLVEASRAYDWKYLYSWCKNWDLRTKLAQRCLAHYENDPLVYWAACRVYLAGGEYQLAAAMFELARNAGFAPEDIGILPEHWQGRYLAALLLSDRASDAESYLAKRVAADQADADALYTYADFLCRLDKYEPAIEQAQLGRKRFPADPRFVGILKRAYWWTADVDGLTTLIGLPDGSNPLHSTRYSTEIRLQLLESDPRFFDHSAPWPNPNPTYQRLFSEAYAITGDERYLQELIDQLQAEWRSYQDEEGHVSYRSRHNAERNSRMFSYVIRAFYLAHDWASLSANLEHYDDLSGWDNIEIWETGLVLRAVASGTPITEFDCSQLLNTNLLPFLLHSSHFDAAVKASGRPRKQVFDEIIAATTPYRGQYSDYSNGALDW